MGGLTERCFVPIQQDLFWEHGCEQDCFQCGKDQDQGENGKGKNGAPTPSLDKIDRAEKRPGPELKGVVIVGGQMATFASVYHDPVRNDEWDDPPCIEAAAVVVRFEIGCGMPDEGKSQQAPDEEDC